VWVSCVVSSDLFFFFFLIVIQRIRMLIDLNIRRRKKPPFGRRPQET